TGTEVYFVGKKNINAAINTLIRMGLTISKADLRGSQSRTISMEVQSGMVEVFRQPIDR
ncbi:MAG: CheD, partial [Bacillota bacterium]|nr:CheD [Bacillota bacterium]